MSKSLKTHHFHAAASLERKSENLPRPHPTILPRHQRLLRLLTTHPPFNRYVGEIVSEAEAEMRQNDAYLFSLDDKVKNHCRRKERRIGGGRIGRKETRRDNRKEGRRENGEEKTMDGGKIGS